MCGGCAKYIPLCSAHNCHYVSGVGAIIMLVHRLVVRAWYFPQGCGHTYNVFLSYLPRLQLAFHDFGGEIEV